MKSLNQEILKFDYEQNFQDQDFYVSKSNEFSFLLLNSWPKWEKNFINLIGEKFSGKSHLINIFLHKFKGIKINAADISNEYLKKIKIYENIIIEDLNKNIDEKLLFTFLNNIEQDNKYLIVTSTKPIVDYSFELNDLNLEISKRKKGGYQSFINFCINKLSFCCRYAVQNKDDAHSSEEMVFVKKFCKHLKLKTLVLLLKEIESSVYYLERNANSKILFLSLSINLFKIFDEN